MNLDIRLIKLEEKDILKKLIFDYEKELTGQDNPEEYKYLDLYWQKETRKPYFIYFQSQLAGFCLVNKHVLVQDEGFNIAEFYIKPEFRNKGIGKAAAIHIFGLFPGKWEIRELEHNQNARLFWKNVVEEITDNNYQETILNDERWKGFVQIFSTI